MQKLLADISVFEPYLKRQNGICSAVGEHVNQDSLKDFFEPHFLFEDDMSLNFKNLRVYQNKLRTLCQEQHMKIFDQPVKAENNTLLLHLPSSILSVDDEALSMWPALNWARIPFVRRLVGSKIISMAIPSWLKPYDDLEVVNKLTDFF